ncbi:MAG TPA: PRC-barrel domain-containing protein [Candidatus Angelobacter sp.]|nr:PRC-barrel domain-containing protein [Candidatus Angelobacter sp.]
MPHYGILGEQRLEDVDDVRGAEVYGVNDEKLGTIDDVVFNHASGNIRYIVLKTGGLFSRKRVMVPVSRIQPYGNHTDKFYAELDKERLEMLPEFNEDTVKSESGWDAYEKEHAKRWNEGAVMYNKDTGHIVTPPTDQVTSTGSGSLSEEARQSLQRDLTPQRLGGRQDDLLGVGGSQSNKTTLQPQRASIAGREDVASGQQSTREVHSTTGSNAEFNTGQHTENESINQTMSEPGIYTADVTPATPTREVMNPMGGEIRYPAETQNDRVKETMSEPRVYVIEDDRNDVNTGANLGNRWSGFQDRLRSRRDKIVVDCPHCASQEKVA